MQSLKSIDVVIAVPKNNFAFSPGDDDAFMPGAIGGTMGHFAGASMAAGGPSMAALGPALGYGLVASLITAGIEHVAAAPAREAAGPVGATVSDIDLRLTLFAQLRALLPPDRAVALTLSDVPLPSLAPGQTVEWNYVQAASRSQADATLYLFFTPLYRSSSSPDPRTHASALLISRAGTILMSQAVQFAGPKAPDVERAQVVQWWADGRYRRFLLHSAQAVLKPFAEGLTPTEAQSARWRRLREKGFQVPTVTPAAANLRSSRCAFDGEPAELVLRHEQMRNLLLIVAACDEDDEAKITPTINPGPNLADEVLGRGGESGAGKRASGLIPIDPDLVWIARTSGATPVAVARTAAR
jgi:hypothetical protein